MSYSSGRTGRTSRVEVRSCTGRGYGRPVDFAWPPSLAGLAEEAAAVAEEWRAAVPEDTWLIGTSEGFAREMGRRGWLGMTWPVSEGGHGRTALERFVVTEALISGGAPIATAYFA